jgi:sodium transport system permease protein
MRSIWTVFCKEWVDALRDRRTLLMVGLSSTVIGPLLLMALSGLFSGMEKRAENRELMVVNMAQAPTLQNFLLRQSFRILAAPADYLEQLNRNHIAGPVLVLPPSFEQQLTDGEELHLQLFFNSANQQSDRELGRMHQLLQQFAEERMILGVAMRGVAPPTLRTLQVQERDLANPQARAARLTGMIPFFVLMAVLYGALNAAMDTTAGERERGSLSPLMLTPVPTLALVLGKWAAAASVGMMIAVLACASFLPGQWLLQSETLSAMFQFGPREAGLFIAVLLPLAAAVTAVMMAVAVYARTLKEAQANNTLVMLAASALPLVNLFNQDGERRWFLWVPGLAQSTLMSRILKGEGVGMSDLLLPLVISVALVLAFTTLVARQLRHVAAH